MINIDDIVRVIHLTPARQNQVCFSATINQTDGRVVVDFKPTMIYLNNTTVHNDQSAMYKSMLFHTGLAAASLETWAQMQNLKSHVTSAIAPMLRDHENLSSWFYHIKDQLIGHIVDYVELQRLDNSLFKDYSYDVGKCHRDFGLFQAAVNNDLDYHTTSHTVALANLYWNSQGQAVSRRPQEVAIHRSLRDKVSVLGQHHNSDQLNQLLDLYDILIDIIENGARPLVQWTNSTSDNIRIEIYE